MMNTVKTEPSSVLEYGSSKKVKLCMAMLVTTGVVLSLSRADAQPENRGSGSNQVDTTASSRKGRITLLPIVFRSPDTGLAGGVLPQYTYRYSKDVRPSNLRIDAYYTQNNQYHIQFTPSIWFAGNRYNLSSKLSYKKWPTTFYPIGIHSEKGDKEKFTERFLLFNIEGQHVIRPGLYAGIRYSLRSGVISEVDPDGVLIRGLVRGSDGSTASGVGAYISWDTRNSVFYPSSGRWYRFSTTFYSRLFGSDDRFTSYGLDLRSYFSPFRKQVVAIQATAAITTGNPSFRLLPGLGENLRGYSSVRYIDKTMMATQLEYRIVPVWWRLGFVLFAGVGTVTDRLSNFSLSDFKYAYGLGLRYQVFRREHINIRIDYGFGSGSSADYIDINEAFSLVFMRITWRMNAEHALPYGLRC